jgi:hypothetical protein
MEQAYLQIRMISALSGTEQGAQTVRVGECTIFCSQRGEEIRESDIEPGRDGDEEHRWRLYDRAGFCFRGHAAMLFTLHFSVLNQQRVIITKERRVLSVLEISRLQTNRQRIASCVAGMWQVIFTPDMKITICNDHLQLVCAISG